MILKEQKSPVLWGGLFAEDPIAIAEADLNFVIDFSELVVF